MNKKVNNLRQICSVTRYKITEGRGSGLDVIDCDNGKIRFMLSPSRGLDVIQMWYRGENVSFISKNGFVNENVPFLERFEGGMLYTCGLDSCGARAGFEQHGTYHLTTAEVTRAEATEDGITVEATVARGALFGKNLILKRRITSARGSGSVKVEDTLTNAAYTEGEYCILYHVNVGYPMLDAGGRIVADVQSVDCSMPYAKKEIANALVIEEPVHADEACYYLTLAKPEISYVNEALGKAFHLRYSGETLPKFLMWKSMIPGDYALGLEPTTMNLGGEFTYQKLAPGESVSFFVEMSAEEL